MIAFAAQKQAYVAKLLVIKLRSYYHIGFHDWLHSW